MTYLRLENDDEGKDTHVDEGAEDGAHQLHVQGKRKDSQDEYAKDRYEDVHCGRASYPSEYEIDDGGNHQYVQNVGERQV